MSNEDDANAKARRRLRIPAALAVAVVGTSASIAMSMAGCSEPTPPEPIDAGLVQSAQRDAGVESDGNIDAMVDAAPEPLDAAPVVVDAYVPPDAPHT